MQGGGPLCLLPLELVFHTPDLAVLAQSEALEALGELGALGDLGALEAQEDLEDLLALEARGGQEASLGAGPPERDPLTLREVVPGEGEVGLIALEGEVILEEVKGEAEAIVHMMMKGH